MPAGILPRRESMSNPLAIERGRMVFGIVFRAFNGRLRAHPKQGGNETVGSIHTAMVVRACS